MITRTDRLSAAMPSADHDQRERAHFVPALVHALPTLLDDVRQHLSRDWPDYAQFMAQEQDELRQVAEAFIRSLVDVAQQRSSGDQPPEPAATVALFEEIGEIQWREERDLSTLLSAYRVGARVAWHHISRAALAAGLEPHAFAALAEAVFVFVDQLSSASARGYVLAQSDDVATRIRLRDELIELLLSDRPDSETVQTAAARAGWPLPREAALILVEPDNPAGPSALARLDASCLPIRHRGMLGAVMPDPLRPGGRTRLAMTLRGVGAVVGEAVPVAHLPATVRLVRLAAQLRRTGVLTDDPVFVDERLDTIIVHGDAGLLAALRKQVLAPLAGLAPSVQDRLLETVTSWLRHMGDRRAVATQLHIHPQTVRYRMGKLQELFGHTLTDPDRRARLILALAWEPQESPVRAGASGSRASLATPGDTP